MLFGGDEENRTPDPLLARQVLSQLSYTPKGDFYSLMESPALRAVPSKLNNTDLRTCEQVLLTNDVRIALFLP